MCPYCGNGATLVDGSVIYPHRRDLHGKPFYRCAPCDAYVGCHPGTTNPLGRLANADLRKARMAAHAAFDPRWKRGRISRRGAYAWLALMLKINPKDCHIGMMDLATCQRVIDICAPRRVRS